MPDGLTGFEKELAKRTAGQARGAPAPSLGVFGQTADILRRAYDPFGLGRQTTAPATRAPIDQTSEPITVQTAFEQIMAARDAGITPRQVDVQRVLDEGTPEMRAAVSEAFPEGAPDVGPLPPTPTGQFGSWFYTRDEATQALQELGEGWSLAPEGEGWVLVPPGEEEVKTWQEILAFKKYEDQKKLDAQTLAEEQGLTPWQRADITFREQTFGRLVDEQQASMIFNREQAIRDVQAQERQIGASERAQQADIAFQRETRLAELQANPRDWIQAALFQGQLPTMPEFLAPFTPGTQAGQPIGAGTQGAKAPMTPLGATFGRFTPPQQEQVLGYQSFLGTDPQEYLRGQRRISPPSGGGRVTQTR